MSDFYSQESAAIYNLVNKLFCLNYHAINHLDHYKNITKVIKKLIKEFPTKNIDIQYNSNININTKREVIANLKLFTIKKEKSKTIIFTDIFVYFENESQICLISRKNKKHAYIEDKENKKIYSYSDSSYLLDYDYEDLENIQVMYAYGESLNIIAFSDEIIITEKATKELDYISQETKHFINHVKIKKNNITSITKKMAGDNSFIYDVQFKNAQASSFQIKNSYLFDIDINPFVLKIIKNYISKNNFDSFIKNFRKDKISSHEAFKFITSILLENKDAMFLSYDRKIIEILDVDETLEACKKNINSNLSKFQFDTYSMKSNINLLKNHFLFNFDKDFNIHNMPDFRIPLENLIALSNTLK